MRVAALIRAARPDDARPVAEVHVASWRHAYRGLLPDESLERLSVDDREAMWRRAFEDPDPKSGAFVAEVDGRIVGFASFGPSRDEDVPDGTGEVPAIYVEPAALGTGVGRELSKRRHSLSETRASRGRPSGCSRRTRSPAASTRRPAGRGMARSARICSIARTSRWSGTRWLCKRRDVNRLSRP
jgi:GNAT superfamily N-acetyltransferase